MGYAANCNGALFALQWRAVRAAMARCSRCYGALFALQWRAVRVAMARCSRCNGALFARRAIPPYQVLEILWISAPI
jgi:uncharacterized protein with PIN domain